MSANTEKRDDVRRNSTGMADFKQDFVVFTGCSVFHKIKSFGANVQQMTRYPILMEERAHSYELSDGPAINGLDNSSE